MTTLTLTLTNDTAIYPAASLPCHRLISKQANSCTLCRASLHLSRRASASVSAAASSSCCSSSTQLRAANNAALHCAGSLGTSHGSCPSSCERITLMPAGGSRDQQKLRSVHCTALHQQPSVDLTCVLCKLHVVRSWAQGTDPTAEYLCLLQ
jgi:hypothetical protein